MPLCPPPWVRHCLDCICYADDLLLISASALELQRVLNICGVLGQELGIKFNCVKSMCLVIGPNKQDPISPMIINESPVQWVGSMKYLDLTVVAGKKWQIDFSESRRKFFSAVNGILSKCNYTSDVTKLQIMESHCLPILL